MKTNNILYDFEQVSNLTSYDVDSIIDTLLKNKLWFNDPEQGFLFNPVVNTDCKLFIKEGHDIYFTLRGIDKVMELMREEPLNRYSIDFLVQTWGQNETDLIVGEELSELAKAYSKARRYELETDAPCNLTVLIENLKEEIADVLICIEIIKSHFGISFSEIESVVRDKMKRNIDRATQYERSTHISEQDT